MNPKDGDNHINIDPVVKTMEFLKLTAKSTTKLLGGAPFFQHVLLQICFIETLVNISKQHDLLYKSKCFYSIWEVIYDIYLCGKIKRLAIYRTDFDGIFP